MTYQEIVSELRKIDDEVLDKTAILKLERREKIKQTRIKCGQIGHIYSEMEECLICGFVSDDGFHAT